MGRPHLQQELLKLRQVKAYLQYHNIRYREDINPEL